MSSSNPSYAESTYSTSTTYSSKPLLESSDPSSRDPKTGKVWMKTKKFLSSLGDPPTAEYDRQQAALKGEDGKPKSAAAVDYGPYNKGGPYAGKW